MTSALIALTLSFFHLTGQTLLSLCCHWSLLQVIKKEKEPQMFWKCHDSAENDFWINWLQEIEPIKIVSFNGNFYFSLVYIFSLLFRMWTHPYVKSDKGNNFWKVLVVRVWEHEASDHQLVSLIVSGGPLCCCISFPDSHWSAWPFWKGRAVKYWIVKTGRAVQDQNIL